MSRSSTDEAIVLRTYNVGETDRFCIVLTRTYGRLALRAPGVRKLLSRRGRGLLPLHSVTLTWDERSRGRLITWVECRETNEAAWRDPTSHLTAMQGVELLLKLTEEDSPLEDVYDLFSAFLRGVRDAKQGEASVLFHLFTLKLLKLFGTLPSTSSYMFEMSGSETGLPVPDTLHHLLNSLDHFTFDSVDQLAEFFGELDSFVGTLLGSQLGASLVTFPFRRASSSGVTPTCQ